MSERGNTLSGKVVVVTGTARGIGAAIATSVARHGGRVVLLDVDEDGLTMVASELGGAVVVARGVDVRDEAALRDVDEELARAGVNVDVLVNNAAVYSQGELLTIPGAEIERCLDVNVLGVLRTCRAFLPRLTARPGGHVINVLSEFAWIPLPNKGSYCVSKAGAAMASACLRDEFARRGVRVTDVVPPAVDTGLVRQAMAEDPAALAREVALVERHAVKAELVGEAVVRVMVKPRPRVVLGLTQRVALLAMRVAPEATRRAAAKMAIRMGLARER
jgi:short-subunit dehydrogenase